MPVAAISVASAVLMGVVLSLLFPGAGTLLFTALPLLGAAIATPLIVQARKADAGPSVLRDAVPMSGAVVSF